MLVFMTDLDVCTSDATHVFMLLSFYICLLFIMLHFLSAINMLFTCMSCLSFISLLLSYNTLRGNSKCIKKQTVRVKGEFFKLSYLIRTFSVFDKGGEDN